MNTNGVRKLKQTICIFTTIILMQSFAWSQGTTTVYKIKHPDGSVSYSDEPQNDAEVMQVEPISTVPAFKPQTIRQVSESRAIESKDKYREFKILSPGHDTAFFSGDGKVSISTKLTPALKKGHQYQFRLDGKVIATQTSGSYTASLVDRGTHTVAVSVLDQNLATLISAASTFTIHRPKISRP